MIPTKFQYLKKQNNMNKKNPTCYFTDFDLFVKPKSGLTGDNGFFVHSSAFTNQHVISTFFQILAIECKTWGGINLFAKLSGKTQNKTKWSKNINKWCVAHRDILISALHTTSQHIKWKYRTIELTSTFNLKNVPMDIFFKVFIFIDC